MGSGASSSIKATSEVQYPPLPKLGVTIRVFHEFIERNGGKSNFEGITTQEVCDKMLMPITSEKKISYCEHLKGIGHSGVSDAVVFVSHSWQSPFLDLVAALNSYVQENKSSCGSPGEDGKEGSDADLSDKEVVLWIDLFCVNLHKPQEVTAGGCNFFSDILCYIFSSEWLLTELVSNEIVCALILVFSLCPSHCSTFYTDWLSTVYRTRIESLNHVVAVLHPWNLPVPFSRAWCLYELYCAETTGAKFGVAMTDEHQSQLLEGICKDHSRYMKMLNEIDMRKSECRNPHQREQILQAASKTVGVDSLNAAVVGLMRKWILTLLKSAGSNDIHNSSFADTLAGSCSDIGSESGQTSSFVTALIQSDPRTVHLARMASTSVLIEEGCHDEALTLLTTIAEEYATREGDSPQGADGSSKCMVDGEMAPPGSPGSSNDSTHGLQATPQMAAVFMNMATAYEKKGELESALEHYSKALSVLEQQEKGGSARIGSANGVRSADDVAARPNSPQRPRFSLDMARVFSNMAVVCSAQADHARALKYHSKALDLRARYYGASVESKPLVDVATAHEGLAAEYVHLQQYEKAIEHYEKALSIRSKEPMGGGTSTSSSANAAALGGASAGTERKQPALGLVHSRLGTVYYHLERHDQALAEFGTAMQLLTDAVGPAHPYVADTLNSIGLLKFAQGRFEEALEDHGKALEILISSYGMHHRSVSDTYIHIATVYDTDGLRQFKEAAEYYQKAVDVLEVTQGKDNVTISSNHHAHGIHSKLAAAYCNCNKYSDALRVHSNALRLRLQAERTENHPHVARIYADLCYTYCGLKDYATALVYCEKSHSIRHEQLGAEHSDTKSIFEMVQQLRQKNDKKQQQVAAGADASEGSIGDGAAPVSPVRSSGSGRRE